uniref:immunoglobulin lambda-1 light chain-like isoform X1 n=1 Tax=Geotrypetes seraphini TaxID=260995 RepID=UPI0014585EC4|nr:immunoglobulin lambda-1 light chain-like isoform X1 [Geotrypetes seraphini]
MRQLQTLLLCVLLCFSYVQSQTPVMSPPVLSARLGQSATFNCDVGVKNNHVTVFLQQIPGEAPKLILNHHHSYSAPQYGPGISAAQFTSTINSAGTVYRLLINNGELKDTALYYCAKWYDSPQGWVFSQSSKLIVNVDSYPKPSVSIFPPSSQDLAANTDRTFTCLIKNLTVGLTKVRWTMDGTGLGNGIQTSLPSRDSDNTFSLSSYLTLPVASLDQEKVYTCSIEQEGSSEVTSQGVKLSEC